MRSFTRIFTVTVLFISVCLFSPQISSAADKEIRFASVSWTGVTIKTKLAAQILDVLGYKTKNTTLPVPLIYKSLALGDIDIFLGNWMPSMKTIVTPFFDKGSVIQLTPNMHGAQYTLAVPTYVAEAGLKSFEDIAKFKEKLDGKIYGIEPGNDGNKIIQTMIQNNDFNLKGFRLVETSEPIMLAQVKAYTTEKKWIVFLGWAPHHMNEMIDMTFLSGSTEKTFGADNGMATVYTNIRPAFAQEQPNVVKFLKNLTFSVEMMNEIMAMMNSDKKLSHVDAALKWLNEHPDVCSQWFDGVTTRTGEPALPVFTAFLEKSAR